MTITVEAGISMQALAETLAAEQQRLPVDAPQGARATIGGVMATNFNGPRRMGQGTFRDYVIGVRAVDGTGMAFKGGGRVVKNVAGYDFPKLLTGSLGTLAVITQVTLKVKPIPEKSSFIAISLESIEQAEPILASLIYSKTSPTAIELLGGPKWQALSGELESKSTEYPIVLLVAFEGTSVETNWQLSCLAEEWRTLGLRHPTLISDDRASQLWRGLTEFPAQSGSSLVLQATVAPSAVTSWLAAVLAIDPQCSFQSHAGNGVIVVRFSEFPESGLSRTLVGQLQPAANAGHGHVVILSNSQGGEMTHQSVWGGLAPFWLMGEVKRKFDPRGILNPGRFVYQGM
jgi:glycolate oxidase FAD binding subunit